jgi:hypothetical protein
MDQQTLAVPGQHMQVKVGSHAALTPSFVFPATTAGVIRTAYEVGDMAKAIVRSQLAVMRSNLLQKCLSSSFSSLWVCSPSQVTWYLGQMEDYYTTLRSVHHGLYLVCLPGLRCWGSRLVS